jgi:hypothetical protein
VATDPEEMQKMLTEHLEMIRKMREAYHLPPGDTPPTFEEMKIGEAINATRSLRMVLKEHDGLNDLREIHRAFWRYNPVHDRDLPDWAWTIIVNECVHPDVLGDLVEWAWTKPEFPEANLSKGKWLQIFRDFTGYMIDEATHQTLPSKPIRLYRGAIQLRQAGLAWTADLERAQWFAERFSTLGTAYVWTTEAQPSQLLGQFNGRDEQEYVIEVSVKDVALHE